KKLLLPYLIFQLIYTGYYYLLGKSNFQNDLFDPQWSLWFLLSLFFWHLLLILFKKIPAFLSISIAIMICLFIAYIDVLFCFFILIIICLLIVYIDDVGSAFSLSRSFAFFPFFLTGYFLTKKHFVFLKKPTMRIITLSIVIIMFVLIYTLPDFNSGWLLA